MPEKRKVRLRLEQWAQSLDPSDPARAAVEDFQLARAARKKKGGKSETAAAGAQIERAVVVAYYAQVTKRSGRLTVAERKLRKARATPIASHSGGV